jgi:hypothetical protein
MENSNDLDGEGIRRVRSFQERQTRRVEVHRRVRSFKTTSKGLINRGDEVKVSSKEFIQYDFVSSIENDQLNGLRTGFRKYNIPQVDTTEPCTTKTDKSDNSFFRVFIMGAGGVGKSSIVSQFMTSEYLGHCHLNVCKLEFITFPFSLLFYKKQVHSFHLYTRFSLDIIYYYMI